MSTSEMLHYATSIAFKFAKTDDPEIESAAGLALTKALASHDPTKSANFKTYLGHCVRNAVRDFFRKEKHKFCSRFGPKPSTLRDQAIERKIPIPDDLLTRYSTEEADPQAEKRRLTSIYQEVLANAA